MVLTQEWQSVASYQISHDTGFSCTFYLDAKYSGQSTANLTTTFQTRLRSVVNSGSGAGSPYKFTLSYANDVQGSSLWTYATETIMEGQGIERHNEDGTKSITLSATMYVSSSIQKYKLNASMSATVDLPTIDRYPILTSATDFNDEENPTITYTTNVGFQNATTYAGISLNGTTDTISYRQVIISNGSYTFSLADNERNILRNATPNNEYLDVYFILKTIVGNDTYYSTPLKRQMQIINNQPTVTYTVQETVQNVITVLGSSSAYNIIENASVLEITASPVALKGASITSVGLRHGTSYQEIKTSPPYTFTVPVKNTNEFIFDIIDSRGSNLSLGFYENLINYTPVSFTLGNLSFERNNPTSSDIILNFEGNYLQTTFGSTTNVPTIKWKLDNGSYTTIPSTNYVIDTTNNKIKLIDYELTNALYYKNKGTFSLELSDLLTSTSNNQDVLAGIPTYDYGEHDLKVNGDLFIADEDGENKVNVLEKLNKIDDLLPNIEYSQTEQIVGKWIDNKPLYRKVIDFGQLPNNTVKSVAHNIQNLKEIVKLSGFARSSINNGGITLPHAVSSPVALYCDNTNINIITTSDRTDFSDAYIYVEYTKTTD